MAKQVIKIGTKIAYNNSNGEMVTARVTSIEKCSCGEKYGKDVESIDFDELTNYGDGYECTLTLDNNKWIYGEQVSSIVED